MNESARALAAGALPDRPPLTGSGAGLAARRDQIGPHNYFSWVPARHEDMPSPAVVLVHGLSMSSRYFLPTAAQLDAAGLRVYAPDLPGFGQSSDPGRSLDLDELAAALLRWLEFMQVPPAAMVANSLGCNVLVRLALACPERVERMVLIGPPIEPGARGYLRVALRAAANMLFEPASFWKIILRDYAASGPRRTLTTLGYGITDRLERLLPLVSVPALVVRGQHDRIVSARWARQVAGLLPEGCLATIAGAAHVVNYSHPRRLAAAVLPFLALTGQALRGSSLKIS